MHDHEKISLSRPMGRTRWRRLLPGGILPVLLLGGCASVSQPPRVAVNPTRFEHARYVEVTYTAHRPPSIRYLETLPAPAHRSLEGTCRPRSQPDRLQTRGVWFWKTRRLLTQARDRRRLRQEMRRLGLDRLYLEVREPLGTLAPLLREFETRGIRVVALSGEPSDIDHPRRVTAVIDAVLDFNRDHVHGFSGLQFDIEPYALPGFARHKRGDYARYARLMREIRARIGRKMKWSVVVPFWFDQVPWKQGSLLAFVLRQADAVAIMAYRSRYAGVLALARPGLCEGQRQGKPVYVGIETAPFPDEDHFFLTRREFRRHLRSSPGHLDLAGRITMADHWVYHYEVKGSALSFYSHPGRIGRLLGRSPAYTSFAGWIIEGLGDEGGSHENP